MSNEYIERMLLLWKIATFQASGLALDLAAVNGRLLPQLFFSEVH